MKILLFWDYELLQCYRNGVHEYNGLKMKGEIKYNILRPVLIADLAIIIE